MAARGLSRGSKAPANEQPCRHCGGTTWLPEEAQQWECEQCGAMIDETGAPTYGPVRVETVRLDGPKYPDVDTLTVYTR